MLWKPLTLFLSSGSQCLPLPVTWPRVWWVPPYKVSACLCGFSYYSSSSSLRNIMFWTYLLPGSPVHFLQQLWVRMLSRTQIFFFFLCPWQMNISSLSIYFSILEQSVSHLPTNATFCAMVGMFIFTSKVLTDWAEVCWHPCLTSGTGMRVSVDLYTRIS